MRKAGLWAAIFVGLFACGKPEPTHPDQPTLKVDRDSLGFGEEFGSGTYLGTRPVQTLYLENEGLKPLILDHVEQSGDPEFTFTLPDDKTIAALGHSFLQVEFGPTEVKTYAGTLVIFSNAANAPQKSIALSGRGINPPPSDGGP